MKKMLFAGFLMLFVSTALFSKDFVAMGKTHTAFGDYRIELSDDPVTINNEQFKTFIVSYENTPMQLKVVVMEGKKCKDYLVISDKLCIKYVCNKDYFGVQRLDNTIKGFATSDESLNRSEYFHQRVLNSGGKGELESAQLIAAYFPMLLKDEVVAAL